MKPGWWVVGALGVAGLGFGLWSWHAHIGEHPGARVPDVSAPDSARVRLQVLNATNITGLARRATFYLRDQGFDVVLIGNSSDQLDSTLVLDRTNHAAWAADVAHAMQTAQVESRPDSTLYVDVTVLVGRSWRPPAQPFYP